MNPVRSSAKAIIIDKGKLLAIMHRDEDEIWFSLPGGGQEPGETLVRSLERECLEELGVEVEVGRLRFVREYIGRNHEFAAHDYNDHQLDHFFECVHLGDQSCGLPANPDSNQIGVSWLPIQNLDEYRLYPRVLTGLLMNSHGSPDLAYLGDVN